MLPIRRALARSERDIAQGAMFWQRQALFLGLLSSAHNSNPSSRTIASKEGRERMAAKGDRHLYLYSRVLAIARLSEDGAIAMSKPFAGEGLLIFSCV
jgi:hypothetical protein